MKHAKKLFALLLVAMMVLALGTSAFAASIRVNRDTDTFSGTDTADTYTAFKIFDVTKTTSTVGNTTDDSIAAQSADSAASGISYFLKADSPWADIVTDTGIKEYLTFTQAADGSGWSVEWKSGKTYSEASAIALANLLWAKVTVGTGETTTYTVDGKLLTSGTDYYPLTIGTAETVANGYYLIQSSLGSNLVLATSDIEITEKNDYPKVTKTLATDSEYAQIGDTITYTLTVTVPDGVNQAIVLTDTMSAGLTFDAVSSIVNNDETPATLMANTDYNVSAVDEDDNSFTITFPEAKIVNQAGKTLTITYTATLNTSAVTGDDANTNTVVLTYSNYTATPVDVGTETNYITVLKYDAADNDKTPLAGATFELYRTSDKAGTDLEAAEQVKLVKLDDVTEGEGEAVVAYEVYRVAADDETGSVTNFTTADKEIRIVGLDKDSGYELRETNPPAGFNPLPADKEVEVNEDNETKIEIGNSSGSVLPSTGGIGTTIFYVVGGILVVAAGVVLITRKRVGKEEN